MVGFMQHLKLDFGCGLHPRDGFVTIDNRPECNPKIVADVRGPIPLPDGCASEILCSHVMEHLLGDDYHLVMMEMHRLLEPGGTFVIHVPHPSSDCAMVQGHVHVMTPQWWRNMSNENWLCGKLIIDGITEVPDPQAVEDGMFDEKHVPVAMRRYFRNIYNETVIHGYKPNVETQA
jgi:predicted SAM-dependent methyltransferase